MTQPFILAPRYRLDDESLWLEGIDPSRHYWIAVNGSPGIKVAIPGLTVSSLLEWKQMIRKFRSLQPGEQLELVRIASRCTIHCLSMNCYAIATEVAGAPVWHLFDQETLDSLLMTAHPDWQCAPQDIDLGRELLARSWQQVAAA
ncbi:MULTISPECIES: hypothetical protein [unclassified Coleofasciculus]|uniref:hypothetical protein n=1 Tax=unclassified Coleofasciculus TaxID=2692782 RepID=UPI00188225D4|nr:MULTISPECIES: hypothetical protein [unclassified Coleofasciculus]MBE9129529.1 hypothetical protein [Coleofasciculus sp. LEGE 07081]MBE9152108.1 hypothetical protein [Coleofasciculus sp. LEGE 07092]